MNDTTTAFSAPPPRPVEQIDTEARERDCFEVPPHEGGTGQRAEAALCDRFKAHLEAMGSVVKRERIPIPYERSSMYTDLHDLTRRRLYEAKSSSDRASVRLAIGQLTDYLRFISDATGCVLLPTRPTRDLEALIGLSGFGLAFEEDGGFAEVAASDARRAGQLPEDPPPATS